MDIDDNGLQKLQGQQYGYQGNMEVSEPGDDELNNIDEDEFFGLLDQESQQNFETQFKSSGGRKRDNMEMRQRDTGDRSNQKKKRMKKLDQMPLSKKLMQYLLRFTFESHSNQDIYQKYAEDRIFREIKNNTLNAISLLIEIVGDVSEDNVLKVASSKSGNSKHGNQRGSQDLVKTAAAVQLGQINRSSFQQINMSDQDKITLIQSIMIILCNQYGNGQIKKHLSKSLINILEKEKNEIKDAILQFVRQILQSGHLDKQIGSMTCIESIINVPLNDSQIQFIITHFFETLYKLGDTLYQISNTELLRFQNQINTVRVNWERDPNEWEDETIDRFKVQTQPLEDQLVQLESWGQLMNKLLGLLAFKKNTLTKEMSFQLLNNQFYFQILYQLILMQLKIQEQIPDCLISFTTSYAIDSQLNSNLVNYLKITSRFIKMILKHRNSDYTLPENIKNTPFCMMLKELVPRAIISLKGLNEFLINYGSLYNEFKVEETKNQIMAIVKQSLKISELQNYFYDLRVSFICDYIAPLLMVTDNDFEDFRKFGTSYLQYLEEFLNLHDKDKIKISAAKLIIRYCKYIHGGLSFFVQFFLENIHCIINKMDQHDSTFTVLQQANDSLLKQKYTEDKQLDMSIITLISVRKQIKQRPDLIELIDNFLITNCNNICNLENSKVSFFITSQIIILISEMSDTLLIKNQDVYLKYFHLILECTQDWNTQVGFQFQVYKNIFDIVSNKISCERLRPIAQHLFEFLIQQIENRKQEIYFESLNVVIQEFRNQIFCNEEVLYKTVNILISKIFSSCEISRNKAKMHLEGVKMPLLILELIVQWDELSQDHRKNLDNYMDPLYQILKSAKEHDISVSILKLFRLNLQKQNGIQTEKQLEFLYLMQHVYDKEEIFVFEIYKIINYIIQTQPQYLVSNKNLFDYFLTLGINGMKTNSRYSVAFDKSLGSLVVHLMMHHFNTLISQENYRLIIQGACYSLKQDFYEQYLETRLLEVILSCFEIDFQLTFSVLEDLKANDKKCNDITNKIMNIILNKVGIFQEVYDKKLYIIGCCKLISNFKNISIVQTNCVQLFTRVLDMLLSIKSDQEFISKKLEQKKNTMEQVTIVNKKYEIQSFSDSSDDDEFETELKNQSGNRKNKDDDDEDDDGYNYSKFDKEDKDLREIYNRNKNKNDVMQTVEEDQQIVTNRKKQLAHTYMHRDVQAMYEDPNDYKKVQKYIQTTFVEDLPEIKNSKTLGALEKNSDNSYEDLRKLKRAQKSLKLLYTPLKKLDEFTVFQNMFKDLKSQLGANINELTGQLTQYQVKELEEILQTQRIINEVQSQEEIQSIRKIVKLRKRQNQEEGQNHQNGSGSNNTNNNNMMTN